MKIFISFQETMMYALAVVVIGLISYPLSALLYKLNKKLLFLLPLGFALLGGIFFILGLFQQGWALFGYSIYGGFALLIALGCLLGSLFLFYQKRQKAKK